MPKLAHLILAHKDPALLERLVKRLTHENADIYIHLDRKSDIANFKHIKNTGNTKFIRSRVITGWGNYSLIQATLNGFEEVLGTGIIYTHINLISGQDYPLKSAEYIQNYFFANSEKTFMSYAAINEGEWPDGRERFTKYSFGEIGFPGKYIMQLLANTILPKRKMPYNLQPYGRSQWLSITPGCAKYVLAQLKAMPLLVRFFKTVWAVDEVFFQTILINSHLKGMVINDNLRFIEPGKDNRPHIFTFSDADELIASDKLFARKFDRVIDNAVLDRIDNAIDQSIK